ncbi:hypothetical protein U1Q18_037150, partial [Sarracenia purpurea var. burkii]
VSQERKGSGGGNSSGSPSLKRPKILSCGGKEEGGSSGGPPIKRPHVLSSRQKEAQKEGNDALPPLKGSGSDEDSSGLELTIPGSTKETTHSAQDKGKRVDIPDRSAKQTDDRLSSVFVEGTSSLEAIERAVPKFDKRR